MNAVEERLKTGYSLKSARRSLNIMLAEWANRGINLFTIEQVTTTLTAGTANYTLGIDTIDILEMVIPSQWKRILLLIGSLVVHI